MKKIPVFLVLSLILAISPAYGGTQDSYFGRMKHDLITGTKNLLGAPLEIPYTIRQYHQGPGRPVIRHTAGFVDGTFRIITRLGSAVLDFASAFLPGPQEQDYPDPKTFF